jgi:acyl carrier protein
MEKSMLENMSDNLEQDLRQLISDVTGKSIEELRPEANFWNDVGIDSIKVIEITVAIEKRFKIIIRDEQIPKISTIKEAFNVVSEALKKKQNEKQSL